MNYCPKCKKKLVVQDFCVECGADLKNYSNDNDENTVESTNTDGFQNIDFSVFENEAKRQLEEQQRLEKEKAEEQRRREEQKKLQLQREEQRKEDIYKVVQKKISEDNIASYQEAIDLLNSISGWKDADKQKAICETNIHNLTVYMSAIEAMESAYGKRGTKKQIKTFEFAIESFKSLEGWRDSKKQIAICKKKIDEINEEQKRLDEQWKAEIRRREEKEAKKKPIRVISIIAFLLLFIVFIFVYINKASQINSFGDVFKDCLVEYGLFAFCMFWVGIYFGVEDFDEHEGFLACIAFLIPLALIILSAIFINTNFFLRIVILIIRIIPELIIGALAIIIPAYIIRWIRDLF